VSQTDSDLCGAHRANQEPGVTCTQPAGWGTNHVGIGRCKRHGGSTHTHERAAVVEIARRECDRLGIPIEIDPGEALIRAVWEAEGNLAFYRAQVQSLDDVTTTEYGPQGSHKEVTHPLVALYHDAERWRAQVDLAALKAGVEERRLRLAQSDSRALFSSVIAAIEAAKLTTDQAEVFRRALADSLRGLEPASLASGPA
jgi:hypothetical protein